MSVHYSMIILCTRNVDNILAYVMLIKLFTNGAETFKVIVNRKRINRWLYSQEKIDISFQCERSLVQRVQLSRIYWKIGKYQRYMLFYGVFVFVDIKNIDLTF